LPEMLEALSDALGDGSEEDWQPRYRKLCCLLSMLRQHKVLGKQKLEPVLPDMYIAMEEAARSERIDLRQPACHGLARVAAAMAEPDAEDLEAAEDEGTDVKQLAETYAVAVPPTVFELLEALLTDAVLEVRISALHAVKKLCTLRPALLTAQDCRLAIAFTPHIISGCQDRRHMQVHTAAQRTMMHVVLTCDWSEAPSEGLQKDAREYVRDFASRTLKHLASLQSEAEHSDEEA